MLAMFLSAYVWAGDTPLYRIDKLDSPSKVGALNQTLDDLAMSKADLAGNNEFTGDNDFAGSTTISSATITNLTGSTTTITNKLNVGNITVTGNPTGVPEADTIYEKNIIRAWANINGIPASPELNGSFNVSGVVKNATGDYTISWDRDFADVNYCVVITLSNQGGTGAFIAREKNGGHAVGSITIECTSITGVATDPGVINIMAIGNQ